MSGDSAKSDSGFNVALNTIQDCFGITDNIINKLETRLKPVLREPVPQLEEDEKKQEMPTDFERFINNTRIQIEFIGDKVNRILERMVI